MASRRPVARVPEEYMAQVYILRSHEDGKLYVGVTSREMNKRLANHNDGKVRSTRARRSLLLLWSRSFETLGKARKFEWMLKYTPAGGKLKKRLASDAGGSSNGRTTAFEAVYLGSSPSPPASDAKSS